MSNRPKLPRQVRTTWAASGDPRELSGPGIVGDGGPRDRTMTVLVGTRNAVVHDRTDVCEVDYLERADGRPMGVFAMTLGGVVKGTGDRVNVTYLLGPDGAAAVATELLALATRSGRAAEFRADVAARLAALQAEGALDDMTRIIDTGGAA